MSCFKVYSYHYYLSYSSFILSICFKRLYYFLLYKSLYFALLPPNSYIWIRIILVKDCNSLCHLIVLLNETFQRHFLKEDVRDARKVTSNKATALEVRPHSFTSYVLHIFSHHFSMAYLEWSCYLMGTFYIEKCYLFSCHFVKIRSRV